jgi:hypothetical protein
VPSEYILDIYRAILCTNTNFNDQEQLKFIATNAVESCHGEDPSITMAWIPMALTIDLPSCQDLRLRSGYEEVGAVGQSGAKADNKEEEYEFV